MAGKNDIAKLAGVLDSSVEAVMNAIVALTRAGEKVTIVGVGTFTKQHKEGRENVENTLKPGTFYNIDPKDVLKFKPSSTLDMSVPKPVAAGRRR